MPYVISRLQPTDYDQWHAAHVEAVHHFKDEFGIRSDTILRDHDDPAAVILILEIEQIDRYQAFLASDKFTALAAQAGGVVGDLTTWFADKLEEVDTGA